MKKTILLFLALLLPGLIFIFLKRFGKNEFSVPVYFEHNVDSLNAACGTKYASPYRIPDSVLAQLDGAKGRPVLIVLDSALMRNAEVRRAGRALAGEELQMVVMPFLRLPASQVRRWTNCVFMIKPGTNSLLVDEAGRIRGYYAMGTREEADRLILEVDILKKNY